MTRAKGNVRKEKARPLESAFLGADLGNVGVEVADRP
jgi:hypothetical protein